MRTLAAARLGLRLAAARAREKISSRGSSSLAATDVWKKKGIVSESEKSLYLRFFAGIQGVNQVVGPIDLSLKNSDEEEYLSECKGISNSRDRSQILFPFHGTAINYHNFANRFSGHPKVDPMLAELNGKLYRFDDTCSTPFQVKDKDKVDEWRPLANPPFTERQCWGPGCISILEGSNKILAWQVMSSAVYCFDVTNPENEWTETSFSLANTLPLLSFSSLRRPIFIDHHPFYLIFDVEPYDLLISAFAMSYDSHSVRPIQNGPIQLPQQYCSEYIQECCGENFILIDHQIVHLGGQQLCLILNKFLSDQNTAILLLLTFEYNIIPLNGVSVDIRTQFIGGRHFRYKPAVAVDKETSLDLKLTAAFVL